MDLSSASFVRPPVFVHFAIDICVSIDLLQTTYSPGGGKAMRSVIAHTVVDSNRSILDFFMAFSSSFDKPVEVNQDRTGDLNL